MSSIGSPIHSINRSLLGEIRNFDAQKSLSTGSAAQKNSAVPSDAVDFSQLGQLFKSLRQLETSSPTEFTQVMSDAASQLKSAAAGSDPQQANFLNAIAEKFESAASSGNLAAFQTTSTAGAQGLYSPLFHHHHHEGVEKTNSAPKDEIKSVAATSSSS